MFENLGEKLQQALKKLSGKGKINEKDIKEVMREVRLSLLEADVNFKIVKEFIKVVSEKANGEEVLKSLTPAQQVIKIVRDELTNLMGSTNSKLNFNTNGITIYMLCGLQGAGKTTNASKLAIKLREKGKNPMLVALDIYRPAAIQQLKVLGKQLDIEVFSYDADPLTIAKKSVDEAHRLSKDVLIFDTAGRLQLDEVLMKELKEIKENLKPTEILLVVDAMVGQEAVNVSKTFNEELGIDGIIMTKMDGDTRGGAALSMREVTGAPIKFIGVGEKVSSQALEEFHPDRMASRILGMGDVLTLIEKAEKNFDEEQAKKLQEKIKKNTLDFNDFLDQLNQMKSMGSLSEILSMIPGASSKALKGMNLDDNEMQKTEAIIYSMTNEERKNPDLLNNSRRIRIAKGSGTSQADVNRLVKQFLQTRKMLKKFSSGAKKGRNPFGGFKLPF